MSPGASADPSETLAAGTVVDGEYRIEGVLGSGGMGVVYRARDLRLDRPVALKVHRDKRQADERLAREATALARLSHPNVVSVYRVGTHGGQVYVAMELVEGGTLRLTAGEPRPWRETLRRYVAAGDGLAAAHAAGLVHRDFKPDNVLLGADGRPRVADFGLARAAGERGAAIDPATVATAETLDIGAGASAGPVTPAAYLAHASDSASTPNLDERITLTGAWIGTPAYMAPEQIDGAAVDARSDQFAFAVAVWEGLHGRRPFAGDTTLTLRASIARQELAPGARNDVPGRIDDVLRRALREDPAERWPSMDAILAALRRDPGARRRQLALGAGALALAAGTAAIAWQARGEPAAGPRCDRGAADIAATWDPSAAGALRAHFAASALPYAADVASRVVTELDRYAAAWSRGHTVACQARAEGSWSAALADRAVVCLANRRRVLAESVAVLRHLEATQIDHAVRITDGLPALDACLDPERLDGAAGPSRDPAVTRQHDDTVAAIAHADALNDIFDPGAVAAAEAAVALAARTGRPELVAEAAGARAEAAYGAGDRDALARFEEAFFSARAAGAEEVAHRAALRLVHVALDDGRLDDARSWLRHAAAGISSKAQPAHRTRLAMAQAMIHERDGKLAEAIASLEDTRRALAAVPDGAAYLDDLLDLESGLLGSTGDLPRAIAAGREAVARTEARYGPDHPVMANRLSNLALSLSESGEHDDEAVAAMRRATEICATARRCRDRLPTFWLNLGSIQSNARSYQDALVSLGRADSGLAELGERGLPDRALVASNRGLIFDQLDRPGEAEAALREALALAERAAGLDHPDVAAVLNNLGSLLNRERRFAEAAPLLERAVAIWAKASPGAGHAGPPLLGLGRAQLGLGRAADAVTTLRTALDLLERGSLGDLVPVARLRLAQAHWAAGQRDQARTVTAAIPTDGLDDDLAAEVAAWRQQIGEPR